MNPCNFHTIDFILCKNLPAVKTMLIAEGYDSRQINTPREIYHHTMVFLKDAGERAEKKLLELHPDKDIILDTFCPKPASKNKASNYSGEKPTITLNLKKEHYIVLILLFLSLVILFKM